MVSRHTNPKAHIQTSCSESKEGKETGRKEQIPHIWPLHHRFGFLHKPSNWFLIKMMTELPHIVMNEPIFLQYLASVGDTDITKILLIKTKLFEHPLGQRPYFVHLYSPTAHCRHAYLRITIPMSPMNDGQKETIVFHPWAIFTIQLLTFTCDDLSLSPLDWLSSFLKSHKPFIGTPHRQLKEVPIISPMRLTCP